MNTAAAWGKFAAEILSGNWDGAMEEMNKVKELINDRVRFCFFLTANVVILRSHDPTIPSDMANSLVSISLLQLREWS